jgi:hypothetical protein
LIKDKPRNTKDSNLKNQCGINNIGKVNNQKSDKPYNNLGYMDSKAQSPVVE